MPVDPLELLNSGEPPIQDFVLLGGAKTPGLAYPTGAGAPVNWDRQKGWGYSGATLIYTGADLSDFDVIVEMWERSHWRDWNDFARVLEKPPVGVRAKALEIVHPLINRAPWKITQAVVRNPTQFEQSPTGKWAMRIQLTAFRAPLPALGKPNGTIPKAGTGILDFSSDPEIAALMAKQAALGGVL